MMALVRGVNAAAMASGSMFNVSGCTSQNTGLAPVWTITLAVDANVMGVVITSSPAPTPSATSARCRAAVQLLVPTARVQPR